MKKILLVAIVLMLTVSAFPQRKDVKAISAPVVQAPATTPPAAPDKKLPVFAPEDRLAIRELQVRYLSIKSQMTELTKQYEELNRQVQDVQQKMAKEVDEGLKKVGLDPNRYVVNGDTLAVEELPAKPVAPVKK